MAHQLEWCLQPGEELNNSEYLRSKNGLFYAVMQSDANFVVYRGDWWEVPQDAVGLAMFSLYDKPGYADRLAGKLPGEFKAVMQGDGNFVVLNTKGNVPLWSTDTSGQKDNWAVMQDDGNFCIKRKGEIKENAKWNTGKTDKVDEKNIELKEMVYDRLNAKVTPNGKPKSAGSNTAINKTKTEQTSTLTMAYTKTTSKGWKTTTTLKVGAKTSVKCGVPGLAEGKVEVNYEQSQGFEWNQTTTESEAVTVSLPVKVAAGEGAIGKVIWNESTIAVPYRMKGMATFASGKKAPVSVNGMYEGIVTHDIDTMWMPYTEKDKASTQAILDAAPNTVLP
ncbi:MAG: ETX/MTX2 family pore-forming toxin [Methylocella sp.]